MSDDQIVWSDEHGDMRKKGKKSSPDIDVVESEVVLNIRRLTSGKGRTIIEITGLPQNKNWCKKLAKELKKSLGVGGAYKNDFIEIHGEQIEKLIAFFEGRNLKFKKIGG
jgi:translation initiation factor 1